MERICVYTSITGNYDRVNEIQTKEKGIDYYLFTNNKDLVSKTWNVIYIEDEKLDNQRLSRKIKMLGHPIINGKYDIYLWMDASVIWKKSIKEFLKKYMKKNSFLAFKHSFRNCIYEEGNECIRLRKDKKENIIKQLNFLRKEKFPENYGLCEMTIFARKDDKKVENTMKMWFDLICKYSKRDQLSFMYCVWKNNLELDLINENVWNNEWVEHSKHRLKSEITDCRIYYGDSSNQNNKYDIELDCLYNYTIKDSTYTIKAKVPKNTSIIEIEITDIPCIEYSDFKITLPYSKIIFFNTIPYQDNNLFYNNGVIRVEGDFKKNKEYQISIKLKKISQMEQYELINKLSTNLIIISDEYNEQLETLKKTQNELTAIKSSHFYKWYLYKDKLKSKLRK